MTVSPAPQFLIVDDDPDHRLVVRRMLERRGYRIDDAETAELGIELYAQGSYDIILLDIMLPGMDGVELLGEMRKRKPNDDTPVIFISARTDKFTILRGLEMGAIEYLTKPLDFDELQIRIATLLRIRTLQRELRKQEQALAQQRALTEMMVTIAHHLNNASSVMLLRAGIMKASDPASVEAFRAIVKQQTEFIAAVIRSLNHAVQSGTMDKTAYDVDTVMIDVKKLLDGLVATSVATKS